MSGNTIAQHKALYSLYWVSPVQLMQLNTDNRLWKSQRWLVLVGTKASQQWRIKRLPTGYRIKHLYIFITPEEEGIV